LDSTAGEAMKHKLPVNRSVTIRMQQDLVDLLDRLSEELEVSRSDLVRTELIRRVRQHFYESQSI